MCMHCCCKHRGTHGLVGYDACFTRRRSRVRTSDCVCYYCSGRVAQMAERRSNKPSVVGSIPTVTMQHVAALAQLGERKTEDLEVPGSIPGGGTTRYCTFRS